MRAAYALLGLVVGIVMDEVIRRRMGVSRAHSNPKRSVRQPHTIDPCDRERTAFISRSARSFLAQDYYDR